MCLTIESRMASQDQLSSNLNFGSILSISGVGLGFGGPRGEGGQHGKSGNGRVSFLQGRGPGAG